MRSRRPNALPDFEGTIVRQWSAQAKLKYIVTEGALLPMLSHVFTVRTGDIPKVKIVRVVNCIGQGSVVGVMLDLLRTPLKAHLLLSHLQDNI